MAKATEKATPTFTTPKELAKELGVDAKRIRAFLRGTEDFGHMTPDGHARNTSWQLSAPQAELVRERFTPSDDDSVDEDEE
jgi:hypothetical protein